MSNNIAQQHYTAIEKMANVIKRDGVGIFPCDTILGIISLVTAENCLRIQQIKQRSHTSFIVLISHLDQIKGLAKPLSETQQKYCHKYWPGPVTLIVKKAETVSLQLTGGKDSIAIRYPKFDYLNDLINKINAPIISTSANISGQSVADSVETCDEALRKQVDFVFPYHLSGVGQASTIVDIQQEKVEIIRQGQVNVENF